VILRSSNIIDRHNVGEQQSIRVLMPDVMRIEFNTRVFNEARSLKDHGYDAEILGFSNHERRLHRNISGVDCYSYYLSDERSGFAKIGRYLSAISMLCSINWFILRRRYHVYHAHNFHVLPSAVISAFIHKGLVVYDAHESWTIHRGDGFHWEHFFARLSEKAFLRFASGFVTVNDMVKHFYEEEYGVRDGLVLYNTHPLCPISRKRRFHDELGLDRDKLVILFQGGFYGKLRGIAELIEASRSIPGNAVVVLLGFGSPQIIQSMKEQILNSGLEGRVFIMPPKPPNELLSYTMSADIGMNLIGRGGKAQDFQSPWKLFEYCMAGLAVISTDLPFHRLVHENYDIGPLVPTDNNPENIAEKINELIVDVDLRKKYQTNARRAAESEFCWERQEEKLLAYYREKLCGNRALRSRNRR